MKNYVNALKHQLDEAAQLGLLAATKTVYMGGGTPSLLGQDAADLAQNVSALTQPSEFSMEAIQTHYLTIFSPISLKVE